jgi:hypothetical protein
MSRVTLNGKLGADITIEEGYRRARLVGLGLLAAMRDALGSLDRVDFIVKLLGMVNAAPNFNTPRKSSTVVPTYSLTYSGKLVAMPVRPLEM